MNTTKENVMQRTTPKLKITVGDRNEPIVLTGEAVEAVQRDAAAQANDALQEITGDIERHLDALTLADLGDLLGLRDHLITAAQAVEVLIECRPLDELETNDAP